MAFADHFSGVAPGYARYRPRYPTALFDHLATLVARRDRAWDCGAGNGQVAALLTSHFRMVVASDPSLAQLSAAGDGLFRRAACTAEASCLGPRSVDLITVGQALHWFDADAFYGEARRVARPGGILAVWSYDLCRVDDHVDPVLGSLYHDTLREHWRPARRHVESGYRTLPFPFDEVGPQPRLDLVRRLTRDELLGYVATWSAVSDARRTGTDPLPAFERALADAWPDADRPRTARWPLALRVGRVG
jgi:SAM-dependent methyltransferase